MITAAKRKGVIVAAPIADTDVAPPRPSEVDSRTRAMLHGAIVPTLLRLAWPNILVMLAQASTGLIETWWVSHLGIDALAGMALVFPVVMLMQMVSAGAMGGGISSAVARALGAGRREEADALVLHAMVVNVALGAFFSMVMLIFGPSIYRALGGTGGELETALSYSNVVFAGNILLWTMNALASVIRGTGNMLVPAMVICAGVLFLVPLSPCLIFGVGPFPELGVAGAGVALVLFYAAGTAVLLWYILSGRNLARFRLTRLRWAMFRDILAVGAVAAVTSLQTNLTVALATALVASASGTNAVAGYGTGVRLEYLLVPVIRGGVPVFNSVGEAMDATGANVTVIFVPARFTQSAVVEAIEAGIPLAVVITEGVPVKDTAEFFALSQTSSTRLIGPNCPGLISPGQSNAGIIPADITKAGRIGLVSKSGTLTYQMMYELRDFGILLRRRHRG